MIMKVFISQAMNGRSNDKVLQEKDLIVRGLREANPDKEIEVIDSWVEEELGSAILYLAESIKRMDAADIVVFGPKWNEVRGCLIEYQVATNYGKNTLDLGHMRFGPEFTEFVINLSTEEDYGEEE
jgi:hypothetical protein